MSRRGLTDSRAAGAACLLRARGTRPARGLAGRACACRRLGARSSTSRAAGRRRRAPGPSTGSPSTRGCACGSTGARSTSARRRRTSAARPSALGRQRAILVEPRAPGRRTRRGLGAAGPARRRSPAPRPRRRRLHRPRLRRLQHALDHGRWPPGPPRPTGAIGVYIGGANRACSQPNLTATWVSAQTAAGWHLIPTYVGLQAPTSSCSSCAKLSSSQATAQGVAAADRRGRAGRAPSAMGPGSPIYFDMESYSPHLQRHRRHPRLPRGLDRKAALARLPLRRLQQRRLRHRRPRRPVGSGYTAARRPLVRRLERPAEHRRLLRPASAWPAAPAHPPVPRRPRRDLRRRRRSTSTTTTSTAATVGAATAPVGGDDPVGSLDLGRLARAGAGAGQGLGLRPGRADRTAGDPRLRRRPGRRRRARSNTNSARSPTSRAPTSPPSTRWPAPCTASTSASRP